MSNSPCWLEPEGDPDERDKAISERTAEIMASWPKLPVEVYQELVDDLGVAISPHIAKLMFVVGVRMKRDGGDVMLTEVWDDLDIELHKAAERFAEREYDRTHP